MDRKISSRLNMANTFKTVCDSNPTNVNSVPAFAALLVALGILLTELRNLVQKTSTKKTGEALDKTNWKEQLSLYLAVVCGAGTSYARKVKDVVLETKFGYAETMLAKQRDTELIETANAIIALQETVAAQLEDYGISKAEMDALKNALAKFEAKNPLPMANVVMSEVDRSAALAKAFELSDFILQDMMKAALIFKLKSPDFYDAMKKASLIRNQGLRHEPQPVPPVAISVAAPQEVSGQQAAPSTSELLGTNVQEINATTEPTEAPALPELSLNGH